MIFPANPSDREFFVEICKRTPDLIGKYGVKGNPVEARQGLDAVLGGYEDMKVSDRRRFQSAFLFHFEIWADIGHC